MNGRVAWFIAIAAPEAGAPRLCQGTVERYLVGPRGIRIHHTGGAGFAGSAGPRPRSLSGLGNSHRVFDFPSRTSSNATQHKIQFDLAERTRGGTP